MHNKWGNPPKGRGVLAPWPETHLGLEVNAKVMTRVTAGMFFLLDRGDKQAGLSPSRAGMGGLDPKWIRLAPNGTNPGLFQIRFQMH